MQDMTVTELVDMVRERGDTSAYGELIGRYQGHAYGLAYSILGDWAEAQDMAQEAFIRAYVNLHTLDKPARFPAWLQRIVFSTCMMWLRTFRPELYRSMGEPSDIGELDTIPDTATITPLEHTEKNEMAKVVLAAIADLPQKYRIPLTMFHLNGLSYQKVADFLEIPINTVKTLIHRAKKKLKPVLEPYAQEALPIVQEVLDEHKLTADFTRQAVERIEGLDQLAFGTGRDNQFIAALDVCLRGMGDDVTYDLLMGYSAAAFRLHFFEPMWCPSSPDLLGGYDHSVPASRAIGRTFRIVDIGGDEGSQQLGRQEIVRSIDAGRPIIGVNLMGNGRYGVIAGYRSSDMALLCRTYDDKADEYSLLSGKQGFIMNGNDRLPDRLIILGESEGAPPVRENVMRSLRIAVELAHTKAYERDSEAQASGFAAYDRWIRDLKDHQLFREIRSENGAGAVEGMADVNGWIYMSLLDARAAAARYLQDVTSVFKGKAEGSVREASMTYHQIADRLVEGQGSIPRPWDRKACVEWARTPAMRHEQAGVLTQALALEKRAVEKVQQAISDESLA